MEDYNTQAPHSALGMRSLVEYRRNKEKGLGGTKKMGSSTRFSLLFYVKISYGSFLHRSKSLC